MYSIAPLRLNIKYFFLFVAFVAFSCYTVGMENKKLRRALAIVALAFMAVFTVTFVIALYDPKLCGGAFSWAALVSGLLGVGLFLVVRFLLKDPPAPEYLPKGSDADGAEQQADEQSDAQRSEQTDATDAPQADERKK